jgi:hypothetical protein
MSALTHFLTSSFTTVKLTHSPNYSLTHSMTHPRHCVAPLLTGQFAESSGEISFPEIPAIVLEKVVQYLYYKVSE